MKKMILMALVCVSVQVHANDFFKMLKWFCNSGNLSEEERFAAGPHCFLCASGTALAGAIVCANCTPEGLCFVAGGGVVMLGACCVYEMQRKAKERVMQE